MTATELPRAPDGSLGGSAPALEDPDNLFVRVGDYRGLGRPVGDGNVVAWVLTQGRTELSGPQLFDELCWRLVGHGLPLWRAAWSSSTLHPQFLGYGYRWWRDRGITEEFHVRHGIELSEDARLSPMRAVMERGEIVRHRLETADESLFTAYPLLRTLRDAGATDYFACPLAVIRGRYQTLTFSTDRRGGFTQPELDDIVSMLPAIAAVAEGKVIRRLAATLLDTYLGRTIGPRVLDGQIRRGYGERLRTILMATDMRGFTALSDRLPGDELIELLDGYFDAVAGPVIALGGEVLKFIGDGVLAIFPLQAGAEHDATATALDAAAASIARVAEFNRKRQSVGKNTIRIGIAMHLGDVFFGNVGSSERLDFTAIGPAVNLASRLEGITKKLDRSLLVSHDFARACRRPLVSLGFHPVRGLSEPEEVFGLA